MTSRQFYIMLCIGVISMKMQKLPSLVCGEYGKDGYVLFGLYMLVNILSIIVVFFVLKHVKLENILAPSKNKEICFFRRLILFVSAVYFLSQALLLYEHIQGLFANTLFDNLSWALFSLLLIFAVFFLAHRGVENIALNFEIYVWIIIGSYVLISILALNHTDLSNILPVQTINLKNIVSSLPSYSFWFGDAFLVLILGLKSKDIKLSKTLLVYMGAMFFMSLLVIEFFGMYGEYAEVQSGLISVLTTQSLLGLNIGRLDWFLIVFAEIGAILSCAVYLYFSNLSLCNVFTKARPFHLKLILIVVLYILDVFYFVDMSVKINVFHLQGYWFAYGLQIIIFISMIIVALYYKSKRKGLSTITKTPQRNSKISKRRV